MEEEVHNIQGVTAEEMTTIMTYPFRSQHKGLGRTQRIVSVEENMRIILFRPIRVSWVRRQVQVKMLWNIVQGRISHITVQSWS